jgi:hypothetical protein
MNASSIASWRFTALTFNDMADDVYRFPRFFLPQALFAMRGFLPRCFFWPFSQVLPLSSHHFFFH